VRRLGDPGEFSNYSPPSPEEEISELKKNLKKEKRIKKYEKIITFKVKVSLKIH
jgi:hypothetical protein